MSVKSGTVTNPVEEMLHVTTHMELSTVTVYLGSDPQRLSSLLLSLGSVMVSIQVSECGKKTHYFFNIFSFLWHI